MKDDPVTYALFLLCLLVQAQEQRIRKLEEFYLKVSRENDRLRPKQTGHLRRVK